VIILTLARHTLHEAARKRLLLAVVLLSALFLVVYGVGSHYLADQVRTGTPRGAPTLTFIAALMAVMAFYIVSFLVSLLAIFVSVGSISSEIESGTILALAARPIRRWHIVAGKWLALASLLGVYLLVVGVGVLALTKRSTGYEPPNAPAALALIFVEALVLLTLSMLGSSILSTLTNGALAFMLYGIAWVGGLVEAIGSIFSNQAMINAGVIASLLIPTDALWKGASFHLQPVAMILAQNVSPAANPFTSATPMAPPMLAYSVGYVALGLLLGMWVFSRKDL
jgi:ABC-type transport system involved in multi-copper enzyme maturation permease subunit